VRLNIFSKKGQSSASAFPSLPPLPGSKGEKEYDPSKEAVPGKVVVPRKSRKKPVRKLKPARAPKKKVKKKPKKKVVKKKPKVKKKLKKPVKKKVKKIPKKKVLKPLVKKIDVAPKKEIVKPVAKPLAKLVTKSAKVQKSASKKVMKKEMVRLKTQVDKTKKRKGELIEKYGLEVDGANVRTEIRRDENGITYNLYIPEISQATSTFLTDIRNELITASTISMKELTDPALFSRIKKRFMEDARKLLREKLPHTEKDIEDFLVGTLMQEMLGLGKIEFLIADPHLEEIVIPSAKEPIRVYSKKYGWLLTNIKIGREEEIVNYSNIIARRVGRQITVLNPLLDAHLVTGDRINAVLYPVNTKGNTITIRKFARDPFTIVDLINNKTCSLEIAALLWLAIEYEMNVLISGGTGSGKTSFLNACMPFIPPNQRIISIEDTRELMLPDFLYWAPLVTRTANPEGKGEVSMLDLLVNSLRMRPDRVVLGEMRRQREAMVLFEAMHTGHSVYSTVHADSAPETVSRLINPPISVPPNLLKAVNINVVMFRDRRKNIRRILQIAEFEADKLGAKSNILYRWVSERDEIVKHSASSRFFEDVSRNTGMSETEIKKDLKEKQGILSWLIKNNIRSLDEIGRVMNLFYRNKDLLLKAVNQNKKSLIFTKTTKKKEVIEIKKEAEKSEETEEKVKEEEKKKKIKESPKPFIKEKVVWK